MLIDREILYELNLTRFVALDIETTGLDYLRDKIIEFGAVRYINGEPKESIEFLINPGDRIPIQISNLTGITDEMLSSAASFSEISPHILDFLQEDPIVAHNIYFDLPFLEYHIRDIEGRANGKIQEYEILTQNKYDTFSLAKIYLPFQGSFSLKNLANYFAIQEGTFHRALSDAKTTATIFLELVDISLHTGLIDAKKVYEIVEPLDDPIKMYFYHLYSFLARGKFHIPEKLDKTSLIYTTNFYNIIGEEDIPDEGKLELEPVDEQEIANFFDKGGILEKSFGVFELRKAQIQMAKSIAAAFNSQQFLVVEAGTGTGKSLAYLMPALKWSIKNYGPFGRVILSTNTKNLQEQLFFKDLPILHGILKEKFKAVLLKGKANYLCLDKWYTILTDLKYRLNFSERLRILPLYFWVKQTGTGDISENNGFAVDRNYGLWSKFIAEDNYCPGKSCKYYRQCFLWRARNNARSAHIVVTNHSLLFSDLAAENAVLSEYTNVVFDEAHNIEKVATEYLGIQISLWHFRELFFKLYQKDRYETGILVQLRKRIQLSDIESHIKDLVMTNVISLVPLIHTSWTIVQGFFKELLKHLKEMIPSQIDIESSRRFRYYQENQLKEKLDSYYNELLNYIKQIQDGLRDLMELLKEISSDYFQYQKQISQELIAQYTQLEALQNNLQFLIAAEWDTWVYWFELPNRYDSDDCRLYGVPLNISEILNDKLYSTLHTAVFTSATLTVSRRFDYFLNRIGLQYVDKERLETLLLASPFNFDEQTFLAILSFIPDPRSAEYREAIKVILSQLALEHPRGTLVLFTSYAMLNEMYTSLRLNYESEKVNLLAQGISGNRHVIISEFKKNSRSVLFGTDSFWEGIDIPGDALEILLITKLPFDVPTEPIVQAKAEMIEKGGGNAFLDYTLPEAVIRFRQGFGRLVRSKSDYGAIIILDNRLTKKMYGRIFLDSLPVKAHIFLDENDFWEKLFEWFNNVGKKI